MEPINGNKPVDLQMPPNVNGQEPQVKDNKNKPFTQVNDESKLDGFTKTQEPVQETQPKDPAQAEFKNGDDIPKKLKKLGQEAIQNIETNLKSLNIDFQRIEFLKSSSYKTRGTAITEAALIFNVIMSNGQKCRVTYATNEKGMTICSPDGEKVLVLNSQGQISAFENRNDPSKDIEIRYDENGAINMIIEKGGNIQKSYSDGKMDTIYVNAEMQSGYFNINHKFYDEDNSETDVNNAEKVLVIIQQENGEKIAVPMLKSTWAKNFKAPENSDYKKEFMKSETRQPTNEEGFDPSMPANPTGEVMMLSEDSYGMSNQGPQNLPQGGGDEFGVQDEMGNNSPEASQMISFDKALQDALSNSVKNQFFDMYGDQGENTALFNACVELNLVEGSTQTKNEEGNEGFENGETPMFPPQNIGNTDFIDMQNPFM